jgi:hypothetical protein
VAAYTAFANAGASGGFAISPTPEGGLSRRNIRDLQHRRSAKWVIAEVALLHRPSRSPPPLSAQSAKITALLRFHRPVHRQPAVDGAPRHAAALCITLTSTSATP